MKKSVVKNYKVFSALIIEKLRPKLMSLSGMVEIPRL